MNKINLYRTCIIRHATDKAESIEEKVKRVTTSNEPIKDGAPLIYTERKQGVLPQYDIRTDRFEIALQAMDKVTRSIIAKRKSIEEKAVETEKVETAE